jgi:hypothetical protein
VRAFPRRRGSQTDPYFLRKNEAHSSALSSKGNA